MVYSLNDDGSDFQGFDVFSDAVNGKSPTGSLLVAAGWVYGTTSEGGAFDGGTIFRMRTGGSDFQVMHSFGGPGDVENPMGSLALYNQTLYGLTYGEADNGALFAIAVPEPSAIVLTGIALLSLLAVARRKQQARQRQNA